jgi:hypothetical protein
MAMVYEKRVKTDPPVRREKGMPADSREYQGIRVSDGFFN